MRPNSEFCRKFNGELKDEFQHILLTVSHRAGDAEKSSFFPRKLGYAILKLVCRPVLPVNIVTDGGCTHDLQHLVIRDCYRVT